MAFDVHVVRGLSAQFLCKVTASKHDTVQEVKVRIEERTSIPVASQRLLNKVLQLLDGDKQLNEALDFSAYTRSKAKSGVFFLTLRLLQTPSPGGLKPSVSSDSATVTPWELCKADQSGAAVSEFRTMNIFSGQDLNRPACICFGRELRHRAGFLLAAAGNSGGVVFKIFRSDIELEILDDAEFSHGCDDLFGTPPQDGTGVALHGHFGSDKDLSSVTAIVFSSDEEQLLTMSAQVLSVWDVASGNMIAQFVDRAIFHAVAPLQVAPGYAVLANCKNDICTIKLQDGILTHNLLIDDAAVSCLTESPSGSTLLAGTLSGNILVLGVSADGKLQQSVVSKIGCASIISIVVVPPHLGGLLVVQTTSSIMIVDCIYELFGEAAPCSSLSNPADLVVRHRIPMQQERQCEPCCYAQLCCLASSGPGYLFTGTGDETIQMCNLAGLAEGRSYAIQPFLQHAAPISSIALSRQETLLAVADNIGNVFLLRKVAPDRVESYDLSADCAAEELRRLSADFIPKSDPL